MFELKNVSKQFGDEYALREISMTIGRGLHFIVGASGSGKTTLLKIISGMEQSFEGEVFYCGQSMKNLTEQDKSYYYNNIFGFVWQDFNLLDDLTVMENIMLPRYLKKKPDQKEVNKVLADLKIRELAMQKAGKLSGGQKQRVAIARELLKDPLVIIADEPTSALDEESSKIIMNILREISRKKTVIIVTHNGELINQKDKVHEIDKGELISTVDVTERIGNKTERLGNKTDGKGNRITKTKIHKLGFSNAMKIAASNIKNKWGRFSIHVLSLIVGAVLLLAAVSGGITGTGQSVFDELFRTYGDSILDISIAGSFVSAGGTDGKENDEPDANVTQDIDGLYEKYLSDERVAHIVFTQAYNDIQVNVDGRDIKIDTSNSVPFINRLTAGVMPMGSDNEVVVPQSFVKKLGLSDKEALGKTVTFQGAIYNWDSGEPVSKPVTSQCKIVGVMDTTVKYDAGEELMEYSVEDSFFFSKSATDEMRAQAEVKNGEVNFSIRAKTPADMIAIKDELNADGIVPLGRFELVEDMVRLNQQTNQQSGAAIIVIGVMSVIIILAVAFITAFIRKREYAIYKVSGYSGRHLALLSFAEVLFQTAVSSVLFLCISPAANFATTAFWDVNILNGKLLGVGILLIFAMGIFSGLVTTLVSFSAKITNSLMTGDR
ncbi:ATP-binding cassette domain-containing protein [uncultured Robinsoniella sp.]|uniref:ABC transporter ATP-binding protein/permease n=1 Tax=uncultured Robinsoniella sp. TaxID=904190 RepID=UPI00374EF0DA